MSRGNIAYIWSMALITIAIFELFYFTVGRIGFEILGMAEVMFDWTSPADLLIVFCRYVWIWFPVLMILGVLLWAYVSSQRPQDVTYPYE